MIGIFAKIPFHSQIRRADQQLAEELDALVDQVADRFSASRRRCEESFFLQFDESSRPSRLRAAETSRHLVLGLETLADRLFGWCILLECASGDPEELFRALKRHWYALTEDGLYLGPRAASVFSGYLRLEEAPDLSGFPAAVTDCPTRAFKRAVEVVYAKPCLPIDVGFSPPSGNQLEALLEELSSWVTDDEPERVLAVTGPGSIAIECVDAALWRFYGPEAAGFLRFKASAVNVQPYGPLISGLAKLCADSGGTGNDRVSSAERGLIEELGQILKFLVHSPYRSGFSDSFKTRLLLGTAAALRSYARAKRAASLPPVLVLEGMDRFPRESAALLLELAERTLSEEGLKIMAAGSRLPSGWPGKRTKRIAVSGPSPVEIAKAARRGAAVLGEVVAMVDLAATSACDPFRFKLALRLAASGAKAQKGMPTEELAAAALSTFPSEFAEYLLALRLGEDILGDEDMDAFLEEFGYVRGLRPFLDATLSTLGFASGGKRPLIASHEAASLVERALADGGEAIKADFAARLRCLHARGSIQPSLALYEREGIGKEDLGSYLDSLSSDLLYGDSGPGGRSREEALPGIRQFLASYGAGDRSAADSAIETIEEAASAAETNQDKAAVTRAVLALARASQDYADRKPAKAASGAKAALIGLHGTAGGRLEARAHRLLGLCSMALEQSGEAADYLSNAFELAEAVQDPFECIRAAMAEGAAQLVLGDLGRAESRIALAESWARRSFRADREEACSFMRGRIAFELGRYEEAETRFGMVRSGARVTSDRAAAGRAEIWAGRAAVAGGEAPRGRTLLGRHTDDAEALWFLAESECWDGDLREAAELAERALARLPPRLYASADLFDWSSGFESMEALAVGFASPRSYLEDQILAFDDLASGLSAGGEEGARRASSLASRAREGRLAALHPQAHLYLFYEYAIVKETAQETIDASTVLSRAFKALQGRTAKMSDSALKSDYTERNRWNRLLFAEARSRKLI